MPMEMVTKDDRDPILPPEASNAKSSASISTYAKTKPKLSVKNRSIRAGKQSLSEGKSPLAGTLTAINDSEIVNQREKKVAKKPPSALRVGDFYKDRLLIYNLERRILQEVMKRPPLYDFTIDLKYRTPDLKFSLYLEIGEVLTDEMEVDIPTIVIENTFAHYKGLHPQYNNLSKVPSGVGGGRTPSPFLHMDVLRELDSVTEKRDQFSSLSGQRFDLNPPKGRKSKTDEIGPLIKGASQLIADLNKSTNKEECTNKRPSGLTDTDPDHNYFLGLLPDLKKLKPRDQRAVKFNFTNAIRECLDRYEDEGS